MAIDWGDGDYERTAATLAPVSDLAVERAGAAPGVRLADVACGTGNAALAAAARGAVVVGVDAAEGLVAQARERASAAGVAAAFHVGDVAALPLPDAAFDAAVSVFGVVFSPAPERAAAELVRVVRPGGTLVVTSWVLEGPIAAAGTLAAGALGRGLAPAQGASWAQLLTAAGASDAEVTSETVAFTGNSPEAWFAEQEAHHPMWRAARRALDDAAWGRLRARSVEVLAAGNEDPSAFRTTSRYLLTRAVRA